MTSWQPSWNNLNAIAAAFLESTPLAASIISVTPPGSYVATGLQLDLGTILSTAPASNVLVVAVDTLTVPAGTTRISATGVVIFARSVQVAGGGSSSLNVSDAGASLQLMTAEIIGSLSVTLGTSAAVPFVLGGVKSPQILTLDASAPMTLAIKADSVSVADIMHSPWCLLSLQLTSAIAGVLADQLGAGPNALADLMLRWVTANGAALLANQASFPALDWADIASMMASAAALLVSTQTVASGAVYVPILSTDLYQVQVNSILGLAQIYDSQIDALQSRQNVERDLAQFGATLGAINQQSAGPLLTRLQSLANETGMLEMQLLDAAVQLQQITATLPGLQQALTDAINDQFQRELVSTAISTMFTLASLYVGGAASILGDPEVLAGSSTAIMKAALEITKSIIDTASVPVQAAIADGVQAAAQAPSSTASVTALQGGQVLAASVASFGGAMNALYEVVGTAIANAPAEIVYAPDFASKLAAAPNLSSFSTGGLDPVTYWNVVVIQTEAAVQPHMDLPEVAAYLTAVKLVATYGAAVGDLQMKLLDLFTDGVSTFAQLQTVYQAKAEWGHLESMLTQQDQQLQAAIGMLQRGYLDVKRSLVSAVDNYRAAFFYQWLQHSNISVDVSMDYVVLAQQAQLSIDSLVNVLSGNPSKPLRPRQDFNGISYTVVRDDIPLFIEDNGIGQAQWSITAGDAWLSAQLGGNTALYLDEVTFILEGATQVGEVELQVATSGRYESMIENSNLRFVSQAVLMSNFYNPGTPPQFISSWKFADTAAYMMPTPYTNWTLTVQRGDWQNVTAITMTMSGKFLPNTTGKLAVAS
ncbi:hypothetical protein BLL42_02415 [Pseudomonas frederiksbergensis]|uniref:Uncharacterized protein n=1 Tax=Pseudomonas frederiksbergensis TaxID=104087 RepID=A0A1J0EFG7_9PSED|nr:hypothetical protein [Pseudomonas frederiksbergensis]APC14640.1 hypothetical protein BLL42_02415 [Pseudomonas frederiksbergensis]